MAWPRQTSRADLNFADVHRPASEHARGWRGDHRTGQLCAGRGRHRCETVHRPGGTGPPVERISYRGRPVASGLGPVARSRVRRTCRSRPDSSRGTSPGRVEGRGDRSLVRCPTSRRRGARTRGRPRDGGNRLPPPRGLPGAAAHRAGPSRPAGRCSTRLSTVSG